MNYTAIEFRTQPAYPTWNILDILLKHSIYFPTHYLIPSSELDPKRFLHFTIVNGFISFLVRVYSGGNFRTNTLVPHWKHSIHAPEHCFIFPNHHLAPSLRKDPTRFMYPTIFNGFILFFGRINSEGNFGISILLPHWNNSDNVLKHSNTFLTHYLASSSEQDPKRFLQSIFPTDFPQIINIDRNFHCNALFLIVRTRPIQNIVELSIETNHLLIQSYVCP